MSRKNTWCPTDEHLKPFIQAVEYFEDCVEPGKPIYHDLLRLASKLPGFTGLRNSTPVENWTEEQRIKKWNFLKLRAIAELHRATSGMNQAERLLALLKKSTHRWLSIEEIGKGVGVAGRQSVHDLLRGLRRSDYKLKSATCYRLTVSAINADKSKRRISNEHHTDGPLVETKSGES